MVNIILISHGAFCEGLLDSFQMIAGSDYGIRAVPLVPGESPETYRAKLAEVIKESRDDTNSGTMILSDISGGTPYLSAAYLSKEFKIALISVMNMPMLLTLALERTEETTLENMVENVSRHSSIGIKSTVFNKEERKQRAKLSINKNR